MVRRTSLARWALRCESFKWRQNCAQLLRSSHMSDWLAVLNKTCVCAGRLSALCFIDNEEYQNEFSFKKLTVMLTNKQPL